MGDIRYTMSIFQNCHVCGKLIFTYKAITTRLGTYCSEECKWINEIVRTRDKTPSIELDKTMNKLKKTLDNYYYISPPKIETRFEILDIRKEK